MGFSPLLCCTTLHYTTLHYTTLHCTALHCTALHCTAQHDTTNQHSTVKINEDEVWLCIYKLRVFPRATWRYHFGHVDQGWGEIRGGGED